MSVASRDQLIKYCFRSLGAPLVEIDVTDEQANDNVDNAIEFFRNYYFDGIEKVYLKHQIVQADIDNGYIELPDLIFGVTKVFPTANNGTGASIFDFEYQLRMNDLRDLSSTSMIYYEQANMHLSLINNLLNTSKQFRWNKLANKLYIDQNWTLKAVLGDYILVECYRALDPEVATKFWDNMYFKKYVTALLKRQWGQNLSKYTGITLPGGISIDGATMYAQGKAEQEELEHDIAERQAPLEFFIG